MPDVYVRHAAQQGAAPAWQFAGAHCQQVSFAVQNITGNSPLLKTAIQQIKNRPRHKPQVKRSPPGESYGMSLFRPVRLAFSFPRNNSWMPSKAVATPRGSK